MPTRIEFEGNAGPVRVWFLSADNPDNIRGYGFQGIVVDEAAMISKDVWQYVLRPTISQTLGWAVFVSTPKGRNWFYDLHTRGMDPFEEDYGSFVFPSNASPYFPESEWADAQRTLPADVFRQEYLAEFLEDSAGVFRNVDGCLLGKAEMGKAESRNGSGEFGQDSQDGRDGNWRPEKVRDVVIGCDVAKHTDFTVLIAMDAATGRCFGIDRFNHLDWPVQKDRILSFVRRYRGRLILDATGVGDPIYDDLKRVYADVEGFKLTSGSKTELIQRLIVSVEQRRVSWPGENREFEQKEAKGTKRGGSTDWDVEQEAAEGTEGTKLIGSACWDVLTSEMKRYEYAISPAGHISYNAPAGYHDDCVIALALANHRRWETESVGRMLTVGGGGRRAATIQTHRGTLLG